LINFGLMNLKTANRYITPVLKKGQPDDNYKFLPLPKPTGRYPYHLSLQQILPAVNGDEIVFHIAGDTGSIGSNRFQRQVVGAMAKQYQIGTQAGQPQFLYHLGDIVYNFGEAEQYARQFFEPFSHYPGPILAIAGNHDSDVNPAAKIPYHSLDAFTAVFCDTLSRPVTFSRGAERKSMEQPNVYWTLQTPMANIIGLYTNIPKYGVVTAGQRSWFVDELKAAAAERPNKALILCLHHAPYSADTNHGSSLAMIELLEGVFSETGIKPDIVFSGHVHNYQRFSKHYPDGTTVPYIVAGAGGYDVLHTVAFTDDTLFTNEHPLLKRVTLEQYCDSAHGFLKIGIKKTGASLTLTGEYYTMQHEAETTTVHNAVLNDRFEINV